MSGIEKLLVTVAKLRDPDTGCPWDIEQSHQSITDCLIDECCELLQTIDRLDMEHMEEELGDVLLQVIFHAQIAKENGHFDFDSVCEVLNEKLVRRHPHVFGDEKDLSNSESVLERWELIKSKEKKRGFVAKGLFKDLPPQLPALMFAEDVHKQIVKKSIDASEFYDSYLITKLTETQSKDESAIGALLFNLVAWCKDNKIEPESALRRYAQNVVDSIESREVQ
ncbi:MAG: Nucleoside triphosphate pyrophosphohydrolase [Puniceicoccaceae bacterium MED-G32]|jgi:MazG family protein|nr:MAG: Nucleoside triphosphate pyrophosphohydrolase [Puniceicoccaceae bacterium MED-G32]|tara:strand:+ start:12549 stop:13220 length:672 start_codon:yes stop_codon:yes gene_type:complete